MTDHTWIDVGPSALYNSRFALGTLCQWSPVCGVEKEQLKRVATVVGTFDIVF